MNDQLDLDDDLRATLTGSADALDLRPVPSGEIARRGTRRRRRKRLLAGGASLTVAVAAVAAVGLRDGDGPSVETADAVADTTSPAILAPGDTTDVGAAGSAGATPTITAPPITTPPTLPPLDGDSPDAATGGEVADVGGIDAGADTAAHPWHDGFIRIARGFQPQPLPSELPDELSELFPQEVRDLFPDGLPPTMDEAIATLQDAGMLDVVTTLIAEHPELGEALYATPAPPAELYVEVTTDGVSWTPVEIDNDMSGHVEFSVHDDQLTLWSFDPTQTDRTVDVAITDDLTTWRTGTVTIPTPAETTPGVQHDAWVQQVVPLGPGWIALIHQQTWIDWESLFPDDLRTAVSNSANGWEVASDDAGITVELDGSSTRLTWDELGLTGSPESALDIGGAIDVAVGDGTGNVSIHPVEGQPWAQLTTWRGMAVLVGDEVLASSDGLDWSPIADLPDRRSASGAAPIGDRLLLTGSDGTSAWLLSPDGTLTPTELPTLPKTYSLWGAQSSAAWLVELYDDVDAPPEPAPVTVEHDGYRVTLTEDFGNNSIVVVDLATDEVVYDRSFDTDDPALAEVFHVDEASGERWLSIVDANGTELLRVPSDVLDDAYRTAYDEPAVEFPADLPADPWRPDVWVVATIDGEQWFTADVADPGPEGPWPGPNVAVNGTLLLYQDAEGWHLVDLG